MKDYYLLSYIKCQHGPMGHYLHASHQRAKALLPLENTGGEMFRGDRHRRNSAICEFMQPKITS